MKNQKVTIEQLAERLGKQVWTKGDLKRIYLNDAGWNTKRMSTKTFIFETEDGEFKVSCRIECPSQPYQWIQSQEEEVKEGIYSDIENALSDTVFIMVNESGTPVDYKNEEVNLYYATTYLTEAEARKNIGNCIHHSSFIAMPRDEFQKQYDILETEHRNYMESQRKETAAAPVVNTIPAKKPTVKKTEITNFSVGTRVTVGRFGHGTVKAEDTDTIEIDFDTEGTKRLLKKFAKIELL